MNTYGKTSYQDYEDQRKTKTIGIDQTIISIKTLVNLIS
jgi:hypothetical protein